MVRIRSSSGWTIIHRQTRLIPLAAVVTPSTLSIRLLTTTNVTQLHVPTVNFTESFWRPWVTWGGSGFIASPSPDITRLFTATSSSAEVLSVPAPFPNSSYTLEFWGPSYKCQKLSEAVVEMQGMNFSDGVGLAQYSSLQKLWEHEIGNSTNLTRVVYSGTAPRAMNNTLFRVRRRWEPCVERQRHTTDRACLSALEYLLRVRPELYQRYPDPDTCINGARGSCQLELRCWLSGYASTPRANS